MIRQVIREMLLVEGAPPSNFARETSHSMGWISPDGVYMYDPEQTDHGAWALQFAKGDHALALKLEEAIRPIIEPPGLTADEEEELENLRRRESAHRKGIFGEEPWSWRAMKRIAYLREKLGGRGSDPYKDEYKVYQMKGAAKGVLLDAGWGKVSNAYTLEVRGAPSRVIEKWMELAEGARGHNPEATHRIFGRDGKLAFEGSYWDIDPRRVRD